MSSSRPYDIVLFGASGYTGKFTAEYIATNLPTDIKWAIAGRSAAKLEAVAAKCKALNEDRVQPVIEVCDLNDVDVGDLARKTSILIAVVGPYSLYGEYAFKACAENGTHYLDVTGEVPWTAKMIKKYENQAKSTGAIMIPQVGFESAPLDLVTWSLVSLIRNGLSLPTKEVICSLHELRSAPSGGTIATALNIMQSFTFAEMAAASRPFAICPIAGPTDPGSASWFTKIFGPRTVPNLGTLTTSIAGNSNTPIVERSWGLLGDAKVYGPRFRVYEYMRTRNYVTGILFHFALMAGGILLALKPFRWLVRKFVFAPGEGPAVEDTKNDRVEYRGVGIPDSSEPPTKKAYCRAHFEGDMYSFSAISLGSAALTLLKDDVVAKKLGGGVLTPATLGQPYIDRLIKAGFKLELKFLDA